MARLVLRLVPRPDHEPKPASVSFEAIFAFALSETPAYIAPVTFPFASCASTAASSAVHLLRSSPRIGRSPLPRGGRTDVTSRVEADGASASDQARRRRRRTGRGNQERVLAAARVCG